MILLFTLLFLTYLFSMVWYGSITTIRERHLWDEERKQASFKRGMTLFVISSILLIVVGFAGWYYLGITFLMYFALVLLLNYFGERRHIKRRARQREEMSDWLEEIRWLEFKGLEIRLLVYDLRWIKKRTVDRLQNLYAWYNNTKNSYNIKNHSMQVHGMVQ